MASDAVTPPWLRCPSRGGPLRIPGPDGPHLWRARQGPGAAATVAWLTEELGERKRGLD